MSNSIKLEKIQINEEWKEVLKDEFLKPYFQEIKINYLREREQAKKENKKIFPPASLLFNAFNLTPFSQVRVVILGQDPYHNKGEAMGLCFSVPRGINIPPSLKNIYKELERSLGIPSAKHGDLSSWAKEGVFMLNAILSVKEGSASSHKNLGWQKFTDSVMSIISEKKEGIIFVLWGNFAKEKKKYIDISKHVVLESVHPSPLAGNKFIGNNHFAIINDILSKRGQKPINWAIDSKS